MFSQHRVVVTLRVFLAALFAILIVFQTLSLPGQFAHMAEVSPDQAHLRWPFTAVAVFAVLCVEVVVVCTWRLLGLVDRDRIFTEASLKWVDAIIWAIGAGWLVLGVVSFLVGINADDPGPVMILMLLTTGVTVFGLLVIVMRTLLRQATTLRADMDAVI